MADISKIKIEDGTYNIKDEVARQGIASLQVPRKIMTNRKIIFLGDSYGTGQNSVDSTVTNSWTTLVPQYLGLSNNQFYVDNENGSGFKAGLTFKSQLERVGANISDKSSITDIIIAGGFNDREDTIADIQTKMAEFFTYAKTNYPNAEFMLAHIGWSRNDAHRLSMAIRSIPAYTDCGKYGCRYLKNTEWILHDYSLFYTDNFHPNQNGQNKLASYLTDAILNGGCDVIRSWVTPTYTMGSSITSVGLPSGAWVKQQQVNGKISLSTYMGYLTCNATNFGNRTAMDILYFSNGLIMGTGSEFMPTYYNLFCTDGTNMYNMSVGFCTYYDVPNNRCRFQIRRQASSDTLSGVNAFLFDTVYLEMDAMYC